jgi:hypothetical protein
MKQIMPMIETPTIDTKFDSYMRNSFDRLAALVRESDANQARGEFTKIQRDLKDLAQKRLAINQSTELTDAGKAARRKALVEEGTDVAKTWANVERKLADIEASITAHEDAASGGLVPHGSYGFVKPTPGQASPEELAREREIRDRLYDLRRIDVAERYMKAARDNDDPELVRAVERAPKSFPLVSADVIEQVREMRIAASSFAPRLKELHNLRSLYSTFLEAARLTLLDLEKQVWSV